jgi:hypothetical protein
MDVLSAVFAAFFIGLLIVTAITFGLGLLVMLVTLAVCSLAFILIREKLRRWRFIRSATPRPGKDSTIIEAQYTEITRSEDSQKH